jgi:hypothetical protein
VGRPHQVQVVERTRVPGGFHIGFRGPQSAVEAVESLVAAERERCDSQSVRVRVDVLAAQADLELRIARR